MTAFDDLKTYVGELADIGHALALLSWDQQTYMPPKAAGGRALQVATLSSIAHERMISPRLGELIDRARPEAAGSADGAAYLRELEHQRDRAMKLPPALVQELALTESEAFMVWARARQEKNFALFRPQLEKLLGLVRRKAECFGYEGHPWNALVGDYERGMPAEKVREYFAPLRDATVTLLRAIREKPQVDTGFLDRKWPVDVQREFALRVIRDMGYDMAAGRMDNAPHPFCTNFGLYDVRITNRYRDQGAIEGLMGAMHETGHALYEQGFLEADQRGPLAEAPSLGIHESQSRFWEVRIGHSQPFWQHYLPIMNQYYGGVLEGIAPERFYRAVNKVEPGLIRVEADEVCYNLHVIIRFELELQLLDGSLAVADLPEAWNALYRQYLGVEVPHDGVGCLQDVHWAYGSFSYFPSYTFGNIYSAMLVEKMEEDLGDVWGQVGRGQFGEILGWLRTNIHRKGRRALAREVVEDVTGKPASADALVRYLRSKYGEIYGL